MSWCDGRPSLCVGYNSGTQYYLWQISYLQYLSQKVLFLQSTHNLRSHKWPQFKVPSIRSEAGKTNLFLYLPWSWNDLQAKLKLETLLSLYEFKLRRMEVVTSGGSCFN